MTDLPNASAKVRVTAMGEKLQSENLRQEQIDTYWE
jgi:hypothetical protein